MIAAGAMAARGVPRRRSAAAAPRSSRARTSAPTAADPRQRRRRSSSAPIAGTPLPADANFCSVCGNAVAAEEFAQSGDRRDPRRAPARRQQLDGPRRPDRAPPPDAAPSSEAAVDRRAALPPLRQRRTTRFQEYCLECGARLIPLPGPFRRARRLASTSDSPLWFWAAFLALLAIALVTAAIVLAATKTTTKAAPPRPLGSAADRRADRAADRADPADDAQHGSVRRRRSTTVSTTFSTTTVQTSEHDDRGHDHQRQRADPVAGRQERLHDHPRVGPGELRQERGRVEGAAARRRRACHEVGVLRTSDYKEHHTGLLRRLQRREGHAGRGQRPCSPRRKSAGYPAAYVRQIVPK